jgi:hypothetical protein
VTSHEREPSTGRLPLGTPLRGGGLQVSDSDGLGFEVVDTITVYVLASDGVLLDVIDDVDLGDPVEAHRKSRTSLKEAALWAYVATCHYERRNL